MKTDVTLYSITVRRHVAKSEGFLFIAMLLLIMCLAAVITAAFALREVLAWMVIMTILLAIALAVIAVAYGLAASRAEAAWLQTHEQEMRTLLWTKIVAAYGEVSGPASPEEVAQLGKILEDVESETYRAASAP